MSVWIRSLSGPIPELDRENLRRGPGEQPEPVKFWDSVTRVDYTEGYGTGVDGQLLLAVQ